MSANRVTLRGDHTKIANIGTNTHAQIDTYISTTGYENSWVPSFTNLTVGDGTLLAGYSLVGESVFAYIHLTFGSTTSISGSVSCTIPTGTIASGTVQPLGVATMNNAGVSQYAGIVHVNTTSTILFRSFTVSGSDIVQSAISSTAPFTWGTGDRLTCQFSYLKA